MRGVEKTCLVCSLSLLSFPYVLALVWDSLAMQSSTEASDLVMKDMEGDRWLSSLLVTRGWQLAYTAAAASKVACPTSFDAVGLLAEELKKKRKRKRRKKEKREKEERNVTCFSFPFPFLFLFFFASVFRAPAAMDCCRCGQQRRTTWQLAAGDP